jgi:hypothetical protein
MKATILRTALILVVLATTAFGAGRTYTCRVTGKTMDKCCCEMKDGKFYCPFTKKTYDKCCCDAE